MILALLSAALLQAGSSQGQRDTIIDRAVRRATADNTRGRNRDRGRRRPVTANDLATAFKDPAAKALLTRARVARMGQDSALTSYDAKAYQRMSAGIGFARLGRDRLIFRAEHAGRVRWQKDVGIWIDLTGARTVLPGVPDIGQHEAGKGIAQAGGDIVPVPYFPGYERLWAGPVAASATVDENGPVHPLAEGAEAYYTYRTGDSITLTLPDHRQYHLTSLDIRPRTPEWNVMIGTLWFDNESAQLVRAAYRFAAPMRVDDFVLDQDPTAFDDVPAWVKPVMFPMRGEVSAITIEYGLYGGRFWLPRNRSAEGSGTASFVRVPFKIEQSFAYLSVNGNDSLPRVPVAPAFRSLAGASAKRAWRDSLIAARRRGDGVRRDSLLAQLGIRLRSSSQCDTSKVRVNAERRYGQSQVPFATRVPCDLSTIENSPDLPASIYDPGDVLFDVKAREVLVAEALAMSAQPQFTLNKSRLPRAEWSPWIAQLRYNRVEGASVGAQVRQEFGGGFNARAAGRFGFSDRVPNAELSIARTNQTRTLFVGGYTHMVSANDWGLPLSFGSSLSAVLFGRDEGFYYRASGAEIGGRTEHGTLFDWRVFTERQRAASVVSTLSLGGSNALPNIATRGAQYSGASLRVRTSHGDNPNGFRIFSDLRVEGATAGDSSYGRGALDLTVTQGVGAWGGALTLSGGRSVGDLPTQRRWYLGGTRTIRGQTPDTAQSGNAYWMSRLEFGRTIQGARPVVFADIGWAGDRTRLGDVGRPLSGVGVGASILDGLIRFDLGRGIYPRRQWRFDAYLEGAF